MAFLDKFNDCYVRSIPETETGTVIVWQEPLAGARYRWKSRPLIYPLWLAVMFVFLLIMPSRRPDDPTPFEIRLMLAATITGVYALGIWYFRDRRLKIFLTEKHVIVGDGKHPHRIQFHEAHLTLEERDGHPVLIVMKPSGDPERIYLDPAKEAEIRELLTKAGWLKS